MKRQKSTISPQRLHHLVRRFLTYSFKDIHFDYRGLTTEEKAICTQAEFRALVQFIKKGDRRGTR